jgi:hypothetical protein
MIAPNPCCFREFYSPFAAGASRGATARRIADSSPRPDPLLEEITMKIRVLVLAASLAFAGGAAHAFHCPADMKKIDAAMAKNPSLSAAQLTEVKKYRAEGEALHKAGKHKESEEVLGKAMKTLGVQ